MPLQVWLPLIDNLDNYGINNLVSAKVQTGVSQSSDGKLGKCYKNTGTTRSVATTVNFSADTFSLCAWVRIDSRNNNWCRAVGLYGSGSYMGLACEHTNGTGLGFHYYKIIDGTDTSVFDTYPITSDNGVWVHYVMCYDGTKYYIYKNGSLVTSANANRSNIRAEMNTLYLFGGTAGGYSSCSINDIRLYDHALSPKEVKVISQGLVAHYQLNDRPCDNLYTGTRNFSGTWVNAGNWTTDTTQTYNGFIIKQRTGVWGGLAQNVTATKGDIFTISFYAKVETGGRVESIHRSNLGNVTTGLNILDGNFVSGNCWIGADASITSWKYCWATLEIVGDDITYLQWRIENSQANKTMWITRFKLEKGNKATAWSPNPADIEYVQMGYAENIVYDSSGYNYHGTTWAYDTNGDIEISSSTPRYSVSTFINSIVSTGSGAGQSSGTQYIYGNCTLKSPDRLTVAFWDYPIKGYGNSTGQGQLSLTNYAIGNNAGADYQTAPLNHRDSGFDVNSSDGTIHKRLSVNFTANEWHHYAITYDGRYAHMYKDGVETASVDMGANVALGDMCGIVLGFSKAGGVWRNNQSKYSDFRLYTTCLSADDVRQLYNTPVSIANNGSVLTQGEFVEL